MGRHFRRIGQQSLCRLHLAFSQQPYLRVLFSFGKVLWDFNTFGFHTELWLLRAITSDERERPPRPKRGESDSK